MQLYPRSNIPKFDEESMPFPFLYSYELWLKKDLNCDYFFAYSEKENALMPLKRYSVKGFVLLQPLFPPVTLKGERLAVETEKQFLNEFTEYISAKKIACRITQSPSYTLFTAVPNHSKFCPFGTYMTDLKNHTEEELFSKVHSRIRSYIKAMEKNDVAIKWGNQTQDDFYILYKQTMHRSHLYCNSAEHFKTMYSCLNSNLICGVVYWNKMPQGAILFPYTNYGAFYLYGASSDKMNLNGSMNYLHWQAMLLLKRKGIKMYDFAGARLSDVSNTKLEGVQNFKKKFGGELIKGYLWKMDINPTKCRLFDNLLKINSILHGRNVYHDIIDEENAKTRTL